MFKFKLMPFITVIILGISLIFNNVSHPKAIIALSTGVFLLLVLNLLKKVSLNKEIFTVSLLLIVTNILSLILSQTGNLGLSEITFEVSILVYFLVLSNSKLDQSSNKLILLSLVGFASIEAIIGVSQFLFREENRIAGTFLSAYNKANYFPNAFALFLLLTTPLILTLENLKLRYFCLLLSATALFLTFSRGGLLVFIGQLSIINLYYFYRKEYKTVLNIVIIIILSGLLALGINQIRQNLNLEQQNLTEKITFNSTERITSINERSEFFINTPKLIIQKPLFGYGPESFSFIYPQVQPRFIANAPHPHNIFLKIAVEKGLIALLLFITLLVFIIKIVIQNKTKILNDPTNALILISILGGFAHNQIDYNLNFVSNYFIIFMLTGMLISNLKDNHDPLQINLKAKITLLLIIVALSGFWLFNEFKLKISQKLITSNSEISAKILETTNYKNSKIILADIYKQQKDSDKEIQTLESHINYNKLDAFSLNRLGGLYLKKNDSKKSNQNYLKAIQIDPNNNWEYFYEYYKQNPQILKSDKAKITQKLQNYSFQAENNMHYTAQTPNLSYAIKLSKLLGQTRLTQSLEDSQERFSTN